MAKILLCVPLDEIKNTMCFSEHFTLISLLVQCSKKLQNVPINFTIFDLFLILELFQTYFANILKVSLLCLFWKTEKNRSEDLRGGAFSICRATGVIAQR